MLYRVDFVVYWVVPRDPSMIKMFRFTVYHITMKNCWNCGYTRLEEKIYVWVHQHEFSGRLIHLPVALQKFLRKLESHQADALGKYLPDPAVLLMLSSVWHLGLHLVQEDSACNMARVTAQAGNNSRRCLIVPSLVTICVPLKRALEDTMAHEQSR